MLGTRMGIGSLYVSGQVVRGGYRIMRKLGEGGMGAVYEVQEIKTGNTYALKTLFAQHMNHPGYTKRFEREAQIMKELKHPNIVQIVDYNVDSVPFLVMERLFGMDLTDRIKEAGLLTFKQSLKILTPVVSALDLAHNRHEPIVHRDLKPDNIFLCNDGTVKLLDFGIAKRLIPEGDVASVLTMAGSAIGTMNFMSPEQARGEIHEIDQRTDIFALGAIFYQMLSGRYAFDGQGIAPVMNKIFNENPTPLAQLGVNVPAGVQEVIDRMLAKNKLDRYPTVTEFLADLQRIDQGIRPVPSSKIVQHAPSTENNYSQAQMTLDALSSGSVVSETHLQPRHRNSRAGLFIVLGTLAVGGAAASYFTNKPPQFRRFIDSKVFKRFRTKSEKPPKPAPRPEPMKAEPKKRLRPKSRRRTRRQYNKRSYYRRGSRRR